VAVREAVTARDHTAETRPELDQLTADAYWTLFIDALHHGLFNQTNEAISGACRYGRRIPFRVKVSLLKIFLHLAGTKATYALLRRRYLPD